MLCLGQLKNRLVGIVVKLGTCYNYNRYHNQNYDYS
jgi:hypothetical protein